MANTSHCIFSESMSGGKPFHARGTAVAMPEASEMADVYAATKAATGVPLPPPQVVELTVRAAWQMASPYMTLYIKRLTYVFSTMVGC